ncbi:MAG TPA: formylglycine-generating enzyme family protein [Terriglobia bacterium]|nr:formylglycine-generating enzyme family protein [Terriglobia bacterium]
MMHRIGHTKAPLNWIVLFLIASVALTVWAQTVGRPGEQKAVAVIENSVGLKLVLIPAGSFIMGSEPDEKGRQEEEIQHAVNITRPFRIGITEVTQKQWDTVMQVNRSQHRGDAFPVEKVSWSSAVEFCKRLSAREGKTYRLPTEAEWEYACRAGDKGAFGGAAQMNDVGWDEGNSDGETHVVASKRPNAWGLFDLHGNVAEWCADYYSPEYPDHGDVDPTGPAEGKARVVRGGSYAYFAASCRCAARSSLPEAYQVSYTGFRVVMEVAP